MAKEELSPEERKQRALKSERLKSELETGQQILEIIKRKHDHGQEDFLNDFAIELQFFISIASEVYQKIGFIKRCVPKVDDPKGEWKLDCCNLLWSGMDYLILSVEALSTGMLWAPSILERHSLETVLIVLDLFKDPSIRDNYVNGKLDGRDALKRIKKSYPDWAEEYGRRYGSTSTIAHVNYDLQRPMPFQSQTGEICLPIRGKYIRELKNTFCHILENSCVIAIDYFWATEMIFFPELSKFNLIKYASSDGKNSRFFDFESLKKQREEVFGRRDES